MSSPQSIAMTSRQMQRQRRRQRQATIPKEGDNRGNNRQRRGRKSKIYTRIHEMDRMDSSKPPDLHNRVSVYSRTVNNLTIGLGMQFDSKASKFIKTGLASYVYDNVMCDGHQTSYNNFHEVYLRVILDGVEQWVKFDELVSRKLFTEGEQAKVVESLNRTLCDSLFSMAISVPGY
jgi:hypothetical protein